MPYVHGRSDRESMRLGDQAATLEDLLHHDTRYPPGSTVLEAGCGVGAQSVILARNSPEALITSIDISPDSVGRARDRAAREGYTNISFRTGDVYHLPFAPGAFDHVFVCFLLEHLPDPVRALEGLLRVLRPGGTITVIEGDHGSAFFYPRSDEATKAIQCLVEVQRRAGGNALIGRELWHLMNEAGARSVRVSPRMVYVDESRPALVEGFTKNTFTAMVEGVETEARALGLIDEKTWEKGISDLYRTMEPDGTFCYTFFKGTGRKTGPSRSGTPNRQLWSDAKKSACEQAGL
nr:methyltransferase domain-containing protein [Methanolinea mesophila]